MKKLLAYLQAHGKMYLTAGSVFLLASLVFIHPAWAQDASSAANTAVSGLFEMLSRVVMAMITLFGKLTSYFVYILVAVAQYNNFVKSDVVQTGYSIVRDISNMFFIIALLVIAGGTVLRIENYRYNKLLGRVVVMAFLVNFSLLIAGFLIQGAQVIMLTFVNAFRDIAFGNFANMFGLDAVLNFSVGGTLPKAVDSFSVFISLVGGLAMMVVAFVVTAALTVTLMIRVVALWVLLILSPLAYVMRLLPNTEGQAARWWKEFGKYVTVGPVVAFFLWLALSLSSQSGIKDDGTRVAFDPEIVSRLETSRIDDEIRTELSTDIFRFDRFVVFLISIIFLVLGLGFANEAGKVGGMAVSKMVSDKGFGIGAAVTGLNAIRDRTIAPVQGMLKMRDARRAAGVQRRAEGLNYRTDQVLSRTVGHVGKAKEAAVRGTFGAVRQAPGAIVGVGKAAGSLISAGIKEAKGDVAGRKAALLRSRQQAGGAVMSVVGTKGFAGGVVSGATMGTEANAEARLEMSKRDTKERQRIEELRNFEKMSAGQRRAAAASSSNKHERRGAAAQMAEQQEFREDPDNEGQLLPADQEIASNLGKDLLTSARSSEELGKAMEGWSVLIRNGVMGGINKKMPLNSGQRNLLGLNGFVKEAFSDQNYLGMRNPFADTAKEAGEFIKRNEKRLAEQFKKSMLSLDTHRDDKMIKSVLSIPTLTNDDVKEGTKNPLVRKAFSKGVADMINNNSELFDDSDAKYKDKESVSLRRKSIAGTRGGSVKLKNPAGGPDIEKSILDHIYRSPTNADQKLELERISKTLGKFLDKMDWKDPKTTPRTEIKNIISENITLRDMSLLAEELPDTVKEMVEHIDSVGDARQVARMDAIQKHDVLSTFIGP